MTNEAQEILNHPCWKTLNQEQQDLLAKEMEGKHPLNWQGMMNWWGEQNDWCEREEELREQQMSWLLESNGPLGDLLEWLQENDSELDELFYSQLVEHLQEPDYFRINYQWEDQPNLSWGQIEMVKANGDMTDRLQDWRYFYEEITEAYLREHGFAEWLDEYLDKEEDEISDDDRSEFVQLIESHIFNYGLYTHKGDAKAGNKLLHKCIAVTLNNSMNNPETDDLTMEQMRGLVETMTAVAEMNKKLA